VKAVHDNLYHKSTAPIPNIKGILWSHRLFFEREGQTRLLKALRILLSEDYTADMLCTDAEAYLADR